jgi:hypothetical protein
VTAVRKDRFETKGSIKAGSNRLVLSGPHFSWGDVVKIPGAGPGGRELSSIIYDFDNDTVAVVSPADSVTVDNVLLSLDQTGKRNDVNLWEGAWGPYIHVGMSFFSTYTKKGVNTSATILRTTTPYLKPSTGKEKAEIGGVLFRYLRDNGVSYKGN